MKQVLSLLKVAEREYGPVDSSIGCLVFMLAPWGLTVCDRSFGWGEVEESLKYPKIRGGGSAGMRTERVPL